MNETSPLIAHGDRSSEDDNVLLEQKSIFKRKYWIALIVIQVIVLITFYVTFKSGYVSNYGQLRAAWSAKAAPLSTIDPAALGVQPAFRPYVSMPGPVFRHLAEGETPLPTNSWYENFLIGPDNTVPETNVFQVPYILDTSGDVIGVRTHPCHVQGSAKAVMMTYELANGVSLGAVEDLDPKHTVRSQGVPAISKLAIELEWQLKDGDSASSMRAPIVRGSPYTSMIYLNTTPKIYIPRSLSAPILIDNDDQKEQLVCGNGKEKEFSARGLTVNREMRLQFDTSDMTWLVFVSEPMAFVCSQYDVTEDVNDMTLAPGVLPPKGMISFFELKAVAPVQSGMVRIAMSNNCTTGQNAQYCGDERKGRDQKEYEQLLRAHAEAYPTANADIEFTFPVQSEEEEELRMIFNWKPALMSDLAKRGESESDEDEEQTKSVGYIDPLGKDVPAVELLVFALPHHQERMRRVIGSSNRVQTAGCMPTIHGMACPATGGTWSLVEHLHHTSFHAQQSPKPEMIASIKKAAATDLHWRMPPNYLRGAGDTYFSGKLLARLGRILIVSDEMGLSHTPAFQDALAHLRAGVEIWLNGSAESPFLYDRAWGGLVMCGCDYHWDEIKRIGSCANRYPNCPALTDNGQNFGAGFYNDHHYHYGYHIYAAAVVSKYDNNWAKVFHQRVLLLVRDIANPSDQDDFFPTWRHKDWYLGFSWASGIVTHLDKPFPNGRNQESVSEAIAAYEAVALYGDVMQSIFVTSNVEDDRVLYDSALRTRDMGRLLMATEIRSAKTYWHVQSVGTPNIDRIYPSVYEAKIVGMIWSMLAQEQTWFGNEPWKSYGIQLMPITPASELRDDPKWVAEMLPVYNQSCLSDPKCPEQGWSILIYACMANIGRWKEAWELTTKLDMKVFEEAGGNGHSMTNTLWYIATRPDPKEYQY